MWEKNYVFYVVICIGDEYGCVVLVVWWVVGGWVSEWVSEWGREGEGTRWWAIGGHKMDGIKKFIKYCILLVILNIILKYIHIYCFNDESIYSEKKIIKKYVPTVTRIFRGNYLKYSGIIIEPPEYKSDWEWNILFY